jgi:sterol desaturase/sphingolipid hydroxylase (fatty acid hydroxylase superfamily)
VNAQWLLAHEAPLRGAAFFALLAALALAERVLPCRGDTRPAWRHVVNLALAGLNTALIRAMLPLLGIVWAARMRDAGIGLLAMASWPGPIEVGVAVLALDLTIYLQHRVLHRLPLLWRTHRVHHSDVAFDVTLGVRFHPFEMIISQGIKLAAIAALGAPALAVLLFDIILQGGSLFTHADLALPPRVDRALRWLIVTPSMHRVHHSVARDETDSNFGFNLTWWDRLFGTYRAAPRRPPTIMTIGLDDFRDPADQGLVALLIQPFRGAVAGAELPHA